MQMRNHLCFDRNSKRTRGGQVVPIPAVLNARPFEITIVADQLTGTATITAVNTATSLVCWDGDVTAYSGISFDIGLARCSLTNATTVTATRGNQDGLSTVIVRGVVLEWDSAYVNSVQYDVVSLANGTTSNTKTISAVTNGVVFPLGFSYAEPDVSSLSHWMASLDLTNSTTVTAQRAGTIGALTVGFAVIDFKASVIQSIQKRSVTLTTSNQIDTDTITAVNVNNALLIHNNSFCTSTPATQCYGLTFADGTTVTLTRNGGLTTSRTVKYTVLEFKPGVLKSIQPIAPLQQNGLTPVDTLINVVGAKAVPIWNGFKTSGSSLDLMKPGLQLTSTTNVRAFKGSSANGTITTYSQVADFN